MTRLLSGSPCPRPHCGGLLLHRDVISSEGRLQEVYCHLCGRTVAAQAEPVYRPCRVRFSPEVEGALGERFEVVSRSPNRVALDSDRSEDIGLPPGLLASLDDDTGPLD